MTGNKASARIKRKKKKEDSEELSPPASAGTHQRLMMDTPEGGWAAHLASEAAAKSDASKPA